ncbi:MAG: TetR/AcrR family transcriptional regulator [Proteobacteria bacterium]|nr:TetR/AcrR family transcriptional regulator [Pseudomonadota bacterium]
MTPRSRWISDLHWVRTGQQSRSQRTQASLLEAAATLFGEKGIEATSVADVAAAAGCSVGSVYHHFRDKQALLYAVFERMSEEFRATTREALEPRRWEGASVADVLRSFLEFSVEVGRDRPAFKRAGILAAQGDPALREHYAELRTELYEGMGALLLSRADEIGHPDPELAVAFVLDQLGSMLGSRLESDGVPTPLANRPDDAFVQEALRSACAYLQLAPPDETGGENSMERSGR